MSLAWRSPVHRCHILQPSEGGIVRHDHRQLFCGVLATYARRRICLFSAAWLRSEKKRRRARENGNNSSEKRRKAEEEKENTFCGCVACLCICATSV